MCYQARSLQSGAQIGGKKVAHTYNVRGTGALSRLSGPREGEAVVPMASVIDTTGARSASEIFSSKEATEKWRRQRPMTESEYREFQSMPAGQQRVMTRFGPVTASSGPRATAWAMAGGQPSGTRRGMVAQPLLIAPSSYQEYLEATERPAPAPRPTRLGIGGGTRSTGLGY
jgi:hypothetical protein